MFQMKIFNLIFLFLIINLFLGCTKSLKKNITNLKVKQSSDSGRFLAARYLFRVGENSIASEIISKAKNVHLDLTLAELNFNNYLINGDFEEAKEFKLVALSKLEQLPMYNLPDFVISLKNEKFLNIKNFNYINNQLPGFKTIFKKINHIKLIETDTYENISLDLKKLDIFDLLIFENTRFENKIYSNMQKTNFNLIEDILFLSYLRRNYPKKFKEKIKDFKLKFNFDNKYLKLYFESKNNVKPNHKFVFANLFANLSFVFSSQKNIPVSYLKILNEISHYLDPTLGNGNYFLANLYSNEKKLKIALNKLNRINENSLMFLYSEIKKYKILKEIDKNRSNSLLKSLKLKYPKNNEVLFLIANSYKDQKKYVKAIKIYDELIKKSRNKNNYYYLKAICLDKLNKWEESKKILIELISKNPNDAYVLNYLSYSMVEKNEDLIEAKKLITKALEIEKNNGYFLDTLGWIQFKMNDIDQAIRTIQQAIELEPNNSEIIDHLGDIYYKVGRKKEAIYEWNRAMFGNANDELKKTINHKLKKYSK